MRLSFCLAAVKNLRKKKKKKKVGRRRSIIKDYSKSAATCKDIPEDILMEILLRLPVDSLMRFKCVSKVWSSLITSRYFTNLFFKYSSSTNPKRHVFVHWNHGELYSSSLCNFDATSSFLRINHQGLDLTLLGNRIVNGNYYSYSPLYFVNAIRGLMCFRTERFNQSSVQIINFATRQRLILPQVETKMKSDDEMVSPSMWNYSMWNYLGYDPVNDEYKVLSTSSLVSNVNEAVSVRSETQVLVLGAGASWRNTKSLITPPPHHLPHRYPEEGGISIKGVLYYGAFSHENVFVLMSFDFSSEDYNLVKFPEDYNLIKFDAHNKYTMWEYLLVNLMNYQDQVAVFDRSRLRTECILDLWVLEDARKSKWSHKFFVLPILELRRTLTANSYKIKGTSRSGEITFCNAFGGEKKINHIIYDLERNQITRVVGLEPLCYLQMCWLEMNIWDDVESIMYLEA